MTDYPFNHGGRKNGGNVHFLRALESGNLPQWIWTPQHQWACEILVADLIGPTSTSTAVITIPSAGFVSGRLTAAIAANGTTLDTVFADAAVGEDETNLSAALTSAITAILATTLAGYVASVVDGVGTVTLTGVEGVGQITVTLTWASAPLIDVQLLGALIDGNYTNRIQATLAETSYDTSVVTARTGGSPATTADMIAQIEIDIEGEAALSDVVISANNDTVDTNTIQFAPGVTGVTVTSTVDPLYFEVLVGGTATDGNYVCTFSHSSLPADVPVTVVRSTTPATNTDIADAMATAIEANIQLAMLVETAANVGASCNVTAFSGVTGLDITTAAPAPGTMVSTALEFSVTDVTPTGPVCTVAYSIVLDLNALAARGRFPRNSLRRAVALEVVTAFGASRTITLGNDTSAVALMGTSAAIDLNTTGRTLHATTDTHYRARYHAAMAPTATISLGSSSSLTTGRAVVQILYLPAPIKEAS